MVRNSADQLSKRTCVEWAAGHLRAALTSRGAQTALVDAADPAVDLGVDPAADRLVVISDADAAPARGMLARAGVEVPMAAESFALVPLPAEGNRGVLVAGKDERGLVYGLLELADRVEHAPDPLGALVVREPIVEQPANAVRSVARCFASEIDDKPWLHSEAFWREYLSMLATQRFNRVNLMVGLGYNFPWHVTDAYLFFPYPFLVDVPGYGVRVPQLPDDERNQNLAMLRFASEQAASRGLDFQLALWTHAYEWFDSPDPRHTVEGLTPDRHAAYCRDALAQLLAECPSISGLTLRTHGESGIAERSWDFWRILLDAAATAGREVRIDLHAKGLDRETLDIALSTGLPITVSPKYAAEHMALPYHPAAIRELDRRPVLGYDDRGLKAAYMAVCEGSRPFTRYSYGDLLRENRPYDVVFRIWPGTQRVLLWGDPAIAAGFSRSAGMAGSQGLEWCEPLSLKGREGTGLPTGRSGYADGSLSTAQDWHKHAYSYRLFGRLLYDPAAKPAAWRRALDSEYGPAAGFVEAGLASASRILPLVTSAHHPSASNNYYWPELYTDLGIVPGNSTAGTHYYDTPLPKRFGTVSPLDPETFSTVQECVQEALAGKPSGRINPWTVAETLERLAASAAEHAARLSDVASNPAAPQVRRVVVDVAIEAALGRFFGAKLKAAVLYEVASALGGRGALDEALAAHRRARSAWLGAVDTADGVYALDLTYGPQPWLRGTWSDRLAAIEADLAAMEAASAVPEARTEPEDVEASRILAAIAHLPDSGPAAHLPPPPFVRGESVTVRLDVSHVQDRVTAVSLRYRHLDQSAAYVAADMRRHGAEFSAVVPGAYSDSPFPLQYHFVVRDGAGAAWRFPGLGPELSDQPYFVVRQRTGTGSHSDALPPPTGTVV